MHERAQCTRHGSLLQIRVIQDNGWCLAAQLEKHRLNVFAGGGSNDRTDRGAPGKADFLDRGVGNKGSSNFSSVGRLMVENVEATGG